MIYAADGKDFFGFAFYLGEGEEQVFGGDVFVLETVGFFFGLVEDIVERSARAGLGAGGFGEAI